MEWSLAIYKNEYPLTRLDASFLLSFYVGITRNVDWNTNLVFFSIMKLSLVQWFYTFSSRRIFAQTIRLKWVLQTSPPINNSVEGLSTKKFQRCQNEASSRHRRWPCSSHGHQPDENIFVVMIEEEVCSLMEKYTASNFSQFKKVRIATALYCLGIETFLGWLRCGQGVSLLDSLWNVYANKTGYELFLDLRRYERLIHAI